LPRAVACSLEVVRLSADEVLRKDVVPRVSILANNDSQRMAEAVTGLPLIFGHPLRKVKSYLGTSARFLGENMGGSFADILTVVDINFFV
jgi:hypothetical protein